MPADLPRKPGANRNGIGFQALRSTFRTLACEARDKAGADWIMGHCPPQRDMGEGVYTAEYSEERLRRITNHVRK